MTFYNIIFGILFIAACRELVLLAWEPAWLTGACVVALIFNDVINTSHRVEEEKSKYTVEMKALDLMSFFVLWGALTALDPASENLELKLTFATEQRLLAITPWPFMLLYWILLWRWNHCAAAAQAESHPSFKAGKLIARVFSLPTDAKAAEQKMMNILHWSVGGLIAAGAILAVTGNMPQLFPLVLLAAIGVFAYIKGSF